MGWLKWLLLLAIVVIVAAYWYCPPPQPKVTTRLELESYGGFAYIHPPGANELSIAFLKDYRKTEKDSGGNDQVVCDVDQLGVDLKVISGTIVSATNTQSPPLPIPANRMFDLANAVVTFPDLIKSSQPLTINRGGRSASPPFGPANPSNEADWVDVKWVPGTSYAGRPTPDYPASTLNPNWPNMIDGRVVLTRGTITAALPSDVAVKDSIFEFKSASGAKNPFKQAVTDTTKFRAEIPADQVVINLTGASSGFTQIVIKPVSPTRPVKLKLIGRHAHATKPQLPLNAAVEHFCTFYQLLQPVPDFKDQLIPHVSSVPTVAVVAGASATGGNPSPGAFCPGDWYPE